MPKLVGAACVTVVSVATLALGSGQALASHVRCGDVITQDTRLDSDLLDCSGDGLLIGADDVTLDLAGHRLDGSGAGAGVRSAGRRRSRIRNGVIEGFGLGVHLDAVTHARLHGVVVRSSGIGIWLTGSDSTIVGSTVSDNGTGIELAGSRNEIVGSGVTTTRFSGPPTYFPTPTGIRLRGASDTRVVRNTVSGYYWSIALDRSTGSHVTRNELRLGEPLEPVGGVPLMGVYAYQGSDNRLTRNRVSGATYALYASEPRARIESNMTVHNRYGMIITDEAREMIVRGNYVADSLEDGIELGAPASLVERNVVLRNRRGIRTSVRATGTVVLHNVAILNRTDGIDAGADSTVTRNVANRNGELGIRGTGAIDGGGNRAAGNGDPLQCLDIVCG